MKINLRFWWQTCTAVVFAILKATFVVFQFSAHVVEIADTLVPACVRANGHVGFTARCGRTRRRVVVNQPNAGLRSVKRLMTVGL